MEAESLRYQEIQQKREEFLAVSRKQRREKIFNRSRMILEEVPTAQTVSQQKQSLSQAEMMETEESSYQQKHHRKKAGGLFYRNFQMPTWLTNPSVQLRPYGNFYMCLRPASERVFLIVKRHKLTVVSVSGHIKFSSRISKNTLDDSLFEGYFSTLNSDAQHKSTKPTFRLQVSDLLIWKRNVMSDSEFDFRCGWLQGNLTHSLLGLLNVFSESGNLCCVLLNYVPLNRENLTQLYFSSQSQHEYSDGVLFVEQHSLYDHGHTNPAVFLWKDHKVSKWMCNHADSSQKSIRSNSECLAITECNSPENQDDLRGRFQAMQIECNQNPKNCFYGVLKSDGVIYDHDSVPLKRCTSMERDQMQIPTMGCIIKFSFLRCRRNSKCIEKDMRSSKEQDQGFMSLEEDRTELSEQEFPYLFQSFQIIQRKEIHQRAPDSISKILFKFKYGTGEAPTVQNISSVLS